MSDFSDGVIYVSYSHANNAAEDLRQQTKAIQTTLQNLDMELQELKTSWEGDDRQEYDNKQQVWNNAVGKMNDLLTQNSDLLNEIVESYQNNEKRLSQGWSEVRSPGR